MREKLIELLKETPIAEINGHIAEAKVCFVSHVFESFADHLIANGVTIPVRCKECVWCEKGKDYEPYCNHPTDGMHDVQMDDFCSYGERRTDG